MEQKYPVVITEQVRWGEMDAFQHLNNVYYFRLFENVRIKYFMIADILAPELGKATGPILAETSCRFRAPIKFPTELLVSARISKIYENGIFQNYEIREAGSGTLAATGEARIVVYDYPAGKISKVTAEMIAAISKLEGRPFSIEPR